MLLSGSDGNSLEYMPRGKVSDTARLIELVVLRELEGLQSTALLAGPCQPSMAGISSPLLQTKKLRPSSAGLSDDQRSLSYPHENLAVSVEPRKKMMRASGEGPSSKL